MGDNGLKRPRIKSLFTNATVGIFLTAFIKVRNAIDTPYRTIKIKFNCNEKYMNYYSYVIV
jgi:hypothetical protein